MQQLEFTEKSLPLIYDLLAHYRKQHILAQFEEETLRGFACSLGRNPFGSIEGLTILIRALKRSGFGKQYLSNAFLDKSLYDKMWERIQ